MENWFVLAKKIKIKCCYLYLYYTYIHTITYVLTTTYYESQLLHQKSIDFNCQNGFQRGMPFRAVHPPRNSKGKTTPIKHRPHSCVVDPFANRKLMLPLVLILLMCQTPPWTNQNKNDLESEASQFLHQKSIDFNCQNGFKGGCSSELFAPQKAVRKKTPQ